MTPIIKTEILNRVVEVFNSTRIDCPACEGMGDDSQYTCEVCWCEGGEGTILIGNIVGQFALLNEVK